MSSLGEQLRRARKAVGFSQREVARRAGVDLSTVSRLERGGNAHLSTVEKIAEAVRHGLQLVPLPEPPQEGAREPSRTRLPRSLEEVGEVEGFLVKRALKNGGRLNDPVPRLARAAGCKEWRIWKALRSLQDWGWLERVERRTGRGRGSVYKLTHDGLQAASGRTEP